MKGPFKYTKTEIAGMKVPLGGSMCANCKYLGKDRKTCTEENFIIWNKSKFIPGDINAYCSVWYEPAEKQARQRFENVAHSEKGE